MWFPLMAHVFLLFSAVTEHTLELSHPRGEEAVALSTNFHASLAECCSWGSISTCPVFLQASAAKENSQTVAGNLPQEAISKFKSLECQGYEKSTNSSALWLSDNHVCPISVAQPLPSKLNSTTSPYMSFLENMLPVSSASELPPPTYPTWPVSFSYSVDWNCLSFIHTNLLAFLYQRLLWDFSKFMESLPWKQ